MNRLQRSAVAGLALSALAACGDATQPPGGAATAPQAVLFAANAAPGAEDTPTQFARAVLQSACLDTRPDFSDAKRALATAGGFVQNARTGTYFHQRHDMSTKVVPGRCSLVAGTAQDPTALLQIRTLEGVRAGTPRPHSGRVYVSMFVEGG